MRFLARRLLHAIYLLLGISLLSFGLLELAPGDFFSEMRLNSEVSRADLEAMRARYGLDRSFPVKYARWLESAVKGDFGVSIAYNVPAGDLLRTRAGNTLLLAGTAMALSWLLAVPLGIWTAAGKSRACERAVVAIESTFLSFPDLLLGMGLLFLALRTGIFPVGGMSAGAGGTGGPAAQASELIHHLALPVVALVAGALPGLLRHVRAAIREALAAPFVQAARAHGIPRRRLLFRHVLPAAANPLLSLFGISVAELLSSSLLIEVVMGWPGLGPLLVEAMAARDVHIVIGAVMLSSLFLVGGNLIADLLLYARDPRIRMEAQ